jgi:hypothetical protein
MSRHALVLVALLAGTRVARAEGLLGVEVGISRFTDQLVRFDSGQSVAVRGAVRVRAQDCTNCLHERVEAGAMIRHESGVGTLEATGPGGVSRLTWRLESFELLVGARGGLGTWLRPWAEAFIGVGKFFGSLDANGFAYPGPRDTGFAYHLAAGGEVMLGPVSVGGFVGLDRILLQNALASATLGATATVDF